jgi:hypothetical protein
MILAGDRNITNSRPVKNGVLEVLTNLPTGTPTNIYQQAGYIVYDKAGNVYLPDGSTWSSEMHNKAGNLLLSDGSVQLVSITGLRSAVENTGLATNRLQMPILTP